MLSHGDLLVMDGSAQDELLHQTNPGVSTDKLDVQMV